MNFTTPVFLIYFLPLLIVLFFIIPEKYKNFFLIISSAIFYFWGEGLYLLFFYLWIGINYITSLLIKSSNKFSLHYLIISLFINLGILIYFKYTNFISENLKLFLNNHFILREIYLPLAVSFFAFHAISYNIDVFKKTSLPEKSFSRLVLYFTLFPHLIAGPILRYHQVKDQLVKKSLSWENASEGIFRFVIGLSKKLLIADTLAPIVDEIFGIGPANLSWEQAWLGAICFTLQLYYDFSGYSDMAIGLARIFGFRFPENFNYPYISKSITEFWRRWHITLSHWFRDYVYIPLGGSRKGTFRTYLNILVVFLLVGIWHGANWTFIVWGLIQGFFLVAERVKNRFLLKNLPDFIMHIYVFLALTISWVVFRSENLSEAFKFLKLMIINGNFSQNIYYSTNYFLRTDVLLAIFIGTLFATTLPLWIFNKLPYRSDFLVRGLRLTVFVFLLFFCLTYISGGSYQSFIYFRF